MNKVEKKLRKIKGLYSQLSLKNQNDAVQRAENDHYQTKQYVDFEFSYCMRYSSFELNVYKNTVRHGYTGLSFGTASGLDYYNLMDVMFSGDNFEGVNMKRFNEYIDYLTKFVRKALKDGMQSMDYVMQTEYVKVPNYLDFKEKE